MQLLPPLKFSKNSSSNFLLITGVFVVFAGIPLTVFLTQKSGDVTKNPKAATVRDPALWPFDKYSPWNVPIGSKANYIDTQINMSGKWQDVEGELVFLNAAAPLRTLFAGTTSGGEQWWNYPAGGGGPSCNTSLANKGQVYVDDNYIVPDPINGGEDGSLPNRGGGALKTDGKTIQEFQYSTRCAATGPVTAGAIRTTYDILGNGIPTNNSTTSPEGYGAHGGSGLSGVAGSVRKWEVTDTGPIRHALKMTVNSLVLSKCNGGFRWPAIIADNGNNVVGDQNEYAGPVCDFRMGSLTAINPSVDCQTFVTTTFGKRVCQALQDYGAYIVDTGPRTQGAMTILGEYGTASAFDGSGSDIVKMFDNLFVISNNASSTPGGCAISDTTCSRRGLGFAPDFGTTISPPPPPPPAVNPPPPPPPPVSGGYTVENLIADTTGLNDGTVCPPVDTYDWGIRGHGLSGNPPSGDLITGWWTAQWISCGASASGVNLQFQNFRTLGWTGSSWITFPGNYNDWCGTFNPDTSTGGGSCTSVTGGYAMPIGQRAIHGATNRTDDLNVQCVVTVYDAKYSGSAPVMVNAGADYIVTSASIQPNMFISKYKRLNSSTWTTLGGSSCTAARLRSNPPPGLGTVTNPPPPPPVNPPPPPTGGALPTPWLTGDIGTVGLAGSASYSSSSGTFNLVGSGDDIWNSADAFRFAYQTLNGDGSIVARINSQTNSDPWAKAGVMIREDLTSGSTNVLWTSTVANGLDFQYRPSAGFNGGTYTNQGSFSYPIYLKLVRQGNTFTASKSIDGVNFTSVASVGVTMNSSVKIGLAVTSHGNTLTSQGVFDKVVVSASATVAKIGDLNNDNLVNGSDLAVLLSKWGTSDATADLSKNGKVDSADLAILLSKWGS